MTAPHPLDRKPWSGRRWYITIAVVLGMQFGLIYYYDFSQPRQEVTPPQIFSTAIQLAPNPWSPQQLALLPDWRDPALFPLPNLHGFSGSGWLRFAPREHKFLDWTDSPHWLSLKAQELGATFHDYVDDNTLPPLRIANKPAPPLTGEDLLVPPVPVPEESRAFIEGDLASRPLHHPLALRSWLHTDILTNTIVRVLVNEEGLVFSATLVSSSGLNEADQFALTQSLAARFEPIKSPPTLDQTLEPPPPRLTWGRLVFRWHTISPVTTTNNTLPLP